MKLLYLAFNTKGYGETALGVHLATRLTRGGHRARFIVPASMAHLMTLPGAEWQVFRRDELAAVLEHNMAEYRPDAIVLVDYMVSVIVLEQAGLKERLMQWQVPILAIDTWDIDRTGFVLDTIGRPHQNIPDWRDHITLRLVPAPIGDPSGACRYSCLPEPTCLSKKVRRHVRRALGLADENRLLLLCSAIWQYLVPPEERARNQAKYLPRLLGHYLNRLGPRVHMIHVGPRAFPIESTRYHWLPSLKPADFGQLLGSVDALVSLNGTSTTITRAITSGIPAVVLTNETYVSDDVVDPIRSGLRLSLAGFKTLKDALPVYPYLMWPIGFHAFLKPLLCDNPFRAAITWTDVLDEEVVCCSLNGLLFDRSVAEAAQQRQRQYADVVNRLPDPLTMVASMLPA